MLLSKETEKCLTEIGKFSGELNLEVNRLDKEMRELEERLVSSGVGIQVFVELEFCSIGFGRLEHGNWGFYVKTNGHKKSIIDWELEEFIYFSKNVERLLEKIEIMLFSILERNEECFRFIGFAIANAEKE